MVAERAAVPGPAPKRIFGAEPFAQVAGEPWSWWDVWCCVVAVGDHRGDLDALGEVFVDRLRGVGNLHARDGNEAKLSHISDLVVRLAAAGLTPEDLATPQVCADPKITRRARSKVLDMGEVEERAKTPAMIETPTYRGVRRARWGRWAAFPSDPQTFYDKFVPTVRKGFVSEDQSFGVARRLGERLAALDGPRRTLADRLALYRAFHTAGLELADVADDSCGVIGELRRDAWETYLRIDWRRAGMQPDAYWQDACELAIWEPYGLDFRAEALWFASAKPEDVALIEAILIRLEAELRGAVLDHQANVALERLADCYVATGTLDECRGAAERLGSRAWRPIVTMATALVDAGDSDAAVDVFAAADQPGLHRDYLRERCREITGESLE